ncbi:MAG: hypothetical protein FWG04_02555 [Desulfovibrionaceae bacterium]|nr:hypothetical protein [Desulfovibrionaceae bacterium]
MEVLNKLKQSEARPIVLALIELCEAQDRLNTTISAGWAQGICFDDLITIPREKMNEAGQMLSDELNAALSAVKEAEAKLETVQ